MYACLIWTTGGNLSRQLLDEPALIDLLLSKSSRIEIVISLQPLDPSSTDLQELSLKLSASWTNGRMEVSQKTGDQISSSLLIALLSSLTPPTLGPTQ